MEPGARRRFDRWPTGDANLDAVLRGGLPRAMLSLVCGCSGSGKSLLAHQLCRAAGPRNLYVIGLGPAEAMASRHAEPLPSYLPASPVEGPAGLLGRLETEVTARGVSFVVLDSLDTLLAGEEPLAARAWLTGLLELLWRHQVTGLACAREPGLAGEAAALVLRLEWSFERQPRRLRVAKYEGCDVPSPEHTIHLGPLGLSFEGAPAAQVVAPVSGLGARILKAFRTARRATPSELAVLLGQDLASVQATLANLAESGYLATEPGAGEPVYVEPRPV